jgi:hypothetical protein
MPAALGVACVLSAGVVKWLLQLGPRSFFNWLLLPMFLLLCTGMFLLCFRELQLAAAGVMLHFRIRMGWAATRGTPTMANGVPASNSDLKD